VLYYVRYELVDEPGKYLEVATTRPETIMADVGLRCIRTMSAIAR
jgi:valyl-tRNA synthetase